MRYIELLKLMSDESTTTTAKKIGGIDGLDGHLQNNANLIDPLDNNYQKNVIYKVKGFKDYINPGVRFGI
jgi:hypothetical protein